MKSSVVAKVYHGWDWKSQLTLAVVFTGCLPLAVGLGVTVGLQWTSLPIWLRVIAGAVTGAVSVFSSLGLLAVCGSSKWFRGWFIPLSRRMFPDSDELARRSER